MSYISFLISLFNNTIVFLILAIIPIICGLICFLKYQRYKLESQKLYAISFIILLNDHLISRIKSLWNPWSIPALAGTIWVLITVIIAGYLIIKAIKLSKSEKLKQTNN